MWHHTWRKNWVNCAVLTGSTGDLRTVLSSHLSHRELCSSLRESHSFLSLPSDITIASSQGTQPSKINKRQVNLEFILHFLFSFSDNIMADVASKQQTTALFLSTIVTCTRRHTELIKKTDKPDGKPVLCQRTFSSVFCAVYFYTVKLHGLT